MALDLNNLKEQIQGIFQDANTTTATQDLSANLTTRVQRVLKLNPALIPVQAEFFPYVSVFVDSKQVEPADFAGTQLAAKRKAVVNLKIVGAVWNDLVPDVEMDEADEDCESLMENIEQVLRGNPTLNSLTTWQFPTRVQYYNAQLGEGASLRAGILDLEATVLY